MLNTKYANILHTTSLQIFVIGICSAESRILREYLVSSVKYHCGTE